MVTTLANIFDGFSLMTFEERITRAQRKGELFEEEAVLVQLPHFRRIMITSETLREALTKLHVYYHLRKYLNEDGLLLMITDYLDTEGLYNYVPCNGPDQVKQYQRESQRKWKQLKQSSSTMI
jgi:hypothetical protein